MNTRIMYIEDKEGLTGEGRIVRVRLSKTGKTIYYGELEFQSLKGAGYKSNYYEVESGIEYWISNPKKGGEDTLYPGTVQIDTDAQEEYWLEIRNKPENVNQTSYRCSGKYSSRKPHAELNVHGNTRNGGNRAKK